MWSLTEHLPVHLVGNGEVGWKEKELLEIKKLNRELENPTEELKDKTEDISRKKIQFLINLRWSLYSIQTLNS